ncbi:hypothetical protein V497_07010 [Pseudogymnoascus sp. VKM F-4516 (FW-969)]|nr:hypothetical protein V497_07010 [Pseudogymnoascus sp. VKM F-4516 (FW-969)]
MHSILPLLALLAAGANAVSYYEENYPNRIYLDAMCLPTKSKLDPAPLSELVAAMANSPFPCEQRIYLERTCFANGTTPNDFLAEQQCLCGSNYFSALAACYGCRIAHGLVVTPADLVEFSSQVSRHSTAECEATPVSQGYTNLFTVNTSTGAPPDLTLSPDPFANDTAISNYWTGPTALVVGKITGSAVDHLSSSTNVDDVRFTPTGVVTAGGSVAAPSATSTAGAAMVRVEGGLVAVAMGVLAAL